MNSKSNGFAEASLKVTKNMVKNTRACGRKLAAYMQTENLTCCSDRLIPSDLFPKRSIKVPGMPKLKKVEDLERMKQIREKTNQNN